MKRLVLVILALITVLNIWSCSPGGNSDPFPVCVGENFFDALTLCREIAVVKHFCSNAFVGKTEKHLFFVYGVDGKVTKIALFTLDRELVYAQGITPIAASDVATKELPETVDELETSLGSYHFDAGSGVYLLSYLTSDATILSFGVTDGVVHSLFQYEIDSWIDAGIVETKHVDAAPPVPTELP